MTGNTMSAVRVALKAAARDQYIVAYIAGSVKFDVGKGLLLAEYTNWWICKPPNAIVAITIATGNSKTRHFRVQII